jgi:hypothetical protein
MAQRSFGESTPVWLGCRGSENRFRYGDLSRNDLKKRLATLHADCAIASGGAQERAEVAIECGLGMESPFDGIVSGPAQSLEESVGRHGASITVSGTRIHRKGYAGFHRGASGQHARF